MSAASSETHALGELWPREALHVCPELIGDRTGEVAVVLGLAVRGRQMRGEL